MSFNRTGVLIHEVFSINMYSTVSVFSLPCGFLNRIFCFLAYSTVRIQIIRDIMHKIYKICVDFMLLVM